MKNCNSNSTTYYGSLLLYLCVFRFCTYGVKVVDLIQFNGDVLADLRYKYLEGVVDLFVVVEGTYTFSGFRKEKLYMNIHEDWFKEIEDKGKILKVVFDEKPTINKGICHLNVVVVVVIVIVIVVVVVVVVVFVFVFVFVF